MKLFSKFFNESAMTTSKYLYLHLLTQQFTKIRDTSKRLKINVASFGVFNIPKVVWFFWLPPNLVRITIKLH